MLQNLADSFDIELCKDYASEDECIKQTMLLMDLVTEEENLEKLEEKKKKFEAKKNDDQDKQVNIDDPPILGSIGKAGALKEDLLGGSFSAH